VGGTPTEKCQTAPMYTPDVGRNQTRNVLRLCEMYSGRYRVFSLTEYLVGQLHRSVDDIFFRSPSPAGDHVSSRILRRVPSRRISTRLPNRYTTTMQFIVFARERVDRPWQLWWWLCWWCGRGVKAHFDV
jgi:hypothetical protein